MDRLPEQRHVSFEAFECTLNLLCYRDVFTVCMKCPCAPAGLTVLSPSRNRTCIA